MSKTWLAAFLAINVAIFGACFFWGSATLLFPIMFFFCFLFGFVLIAIRSSVSADATPGLNGIDEPDFWFSPVFMAWLYVNDEKRWAEYATILSCLAGIFGGSVLGGLIVLLLKVDFPLLGWLLGVLWLLVIAWRIAKSRRWL